MRGSLFSRVPPLLHVRWESKVEPQLINERASLGVTAVCSGSVHYIGEVFSGLAAPGKWGFDYCRGLGRAWFGAGEMTARFWILCAIFVLLADDFLVILGEHCFNIEL